MSISKIKVGSTEHDLQASKLTTARTIGLGTGATGTATSFDGSANITIPVTSVKEAYLDWGGKNFSGYYGCIDAAMVPELGANRLAFMPASAVVVEYSAVFSALSATFIPVTKTSLFSDITHTSKLLFIIFRDLSIRSSIIDNLIMGNSQLLNHQSDSSNKFCKVIHNKRNHSLLEEITLI